jgi:hypothetical protein
LGNIIKKWRDSFIEKLSVKISETLASKITNVYFMREIGRTIMESQNEFPTHDAVWQLGREVAIESAQFIKKHVSQALCFYGPLTPMFWNYVIDKVPQHRMATESLFMEFGVWRGTSINHFANRRQDVIFHGFDSFEGLSEEWSGMIAVKGTFSLGGHIPEVRENVRLYKGWFHDSLPEFLNTQSIERKIAFLHVDCDIYSSTKTIFDLVGERIQDDTVILFDDYLGYPNWQEHAHKVFTEFCVMFDVQYHFIAFNGWRAAVIIDSIKR